MPRLKLDDRMIDRVLCELDEADERQRGGVAATQLRHSYRHRAVQVEIEQSRDLTSIVLAPTRNIGADGVTFLSGQLVHVGTRCEIHLVTIRNSTQVAAGRVGHCRYVSGTPNVHEVDVRFDHPIDPASFTGEALSARVLLADDSEMALRLFSHLLSRRNVQVETAANGVEALAAVRAGEYDLILMDVEMPELDGITATRTLRGQGYVRPIAAISAHNTEDVRADCLAAGCDAFLSKPPDPAQLDALIASAKPAPLVSSMLHDLEMLELIDIFVTDLPARVRRLEAAFASSEAERLIGELRALKGEAGGFGFEPITQKADELEQLFAKGACEHPRRELGKLVRLCMSARPATLQVQSRAVDTVGQLGDELAALTDEQE